MFEIYIIPVYLILLGAVNDLNSYIYLGLIPTYSCFWTYPLSYLKIITIKLFLLWMTVHCVQGSCGSCWAFAATEMIESYAAIATGQLSVLSAQQVLQK